jgi:hypothetical protein
MEKANLIAVPQEFGWRWCLVSWEIFISINLNISSGGIRTNRDESTRPIHQIDNG